MLDFGDDLFSEYGNTSKYHRVKKPQSKQEPIDPPDEAYLKKNTKELVSVISSDWLEESEISSDMIHLDSPSIPIRCQIHKGSFDALYNPVVGINIMALSFAQELINQMPLTPTNKLLKSPSGPVR